MDNPRSGVIILSSKGCLFTCMPLYCLAHKPFLLFVQFLGSIQNLTAGGFGSESQQTGYLWRGKYKARKTLNCKLSVQPRAALVDCLQIIKFSFACLTISFREYVLYDWAIQWTIMHGSVKSLKLCFCCSIQ